MANMMPPRHMLPPDQGPNPQLVKKIVKELKINGVFDEMRKECLADIDTKPAFSNLKQRVEGHVKGILANQHWSPSLNKNQLRSMIRESVMQSGILNEGVDRILYQVFSAKACPVFLPKIKEFVKERGEELMKEFLPPPMEIPPVMMNPLPFEPPPIPISPEVQPELFPPPMPPSQPPPPDSPIIPGSGDHFKGEEDSVQDPTEQVETIHEVSEEILTYEDQEFYVKDVAPEDVVVKAINTPSPHPSTPESADESAPKIPKEAVNPLRSLIQSLLVSKQTILETTENENQEPDCKNMAVKQGKVKVEGRSPTIDPSQIEGFTDDEEEVEEYIPAPGPKTPTDEDDAYEPLEPTPQQPPTPPSEQTSPQSEPRTPSGVYSPLSPGQVFDDSRGSAEKTAQVQIENDRKSDSDSRMTDERSTPAYDPSKFSYQQMSDSTPLHEDDNDQSPPSPTEITDTTEKSQYTDEPTNYRSEGSRYDTDIKENRVLQNLQQSQKHKKKRRSSSDSSESSSSSGSVSSSPSSKDENDQTIVVQEQVVEQEVEEMVEEIEVVEEFTSGGSAEEGEQLKSESDQEEEQVQQQQVVKSHKDKKRKKKTKKRKAKKPKKRVRTSSISSGEITSSNELSSDSSSGLNRPTRPTHPPRKKSLDLEELEERRRILREKSMHDRPYWANTASSSEYLSSPGRIPRPYSPRRPYSPDFHRYKDDLGYGPPPVPHFRDGPMFPGEYHPRHARLSPPHYRRSPPHRYSPGLRMDYPRMPFGSPRSPPRRPYSPPRMMGGYPRERPPFPHPHHRWRSPPRPGPRRPSRSPPPVMRRDDGPGPSRY